MKQVTEMEGNRSRMGREKGCYFLYQGFRKASQRGSHVNRDLDEGRKEIKARSSALSQKIHIQVIY